MTFWDFADKHHDDIFLLILIFCGFGGLILITKLIYK